MKLTKAQEKRFDEWISEYAEADIMGDGEHIKQFLASELSRQRKEIGKDIKKFLNQHWWQKPDIGTKYTSQRIIFDWIDEHLV